ncbi:hypothetical protein A2U01_0024261, partial [Trifolium medium]|nr:hypothetical protein [Trifolium medium]
RTRTVRSGIAAIQRSKPLNCLSSKLLKPIRRQSRYGAKRDMMRRERCSVKEGLIGASMGVECRGV